MDNQKISCLVLTALEQYWPKDKHIVFLGDWCQKYSRKEHWSNLDYELAPDIWKDPDFMRRFDVYCLEEIEYLSTVLAYVLNRVHGENHSLKYWKMMLIHWLYEYIYEWYYHYLEIVNTVELYPGVEIPVLEWKDFLFPLTREQIHLSDGQAGDALDLYHYFIYSRILKGLSQERTLNITYRDILLNFDTGKSTTPIIKTRHSYLKSFIKNLYYSFSAKAPIVCFGLYISEGLSRLRREMIGKVCFAEMQAAPVEEDRNTSYDLELRKQLIIDCQPRDEFEKIVFQNIVYDLPDTVLERYKSLAEFRAKKYRYTPKIAILPGGIGLETAVYLAEWYERGVVFYSTVHSPMDSIFKRNQVEYIFMLDCKKYIWADVRDERCRCCPSFKAFENKVREVPVEEKKTILWCGGGVGRTSRYMMINMPMYRNREMRQRQMDNFTACLSGMKKELLKKLLLRPRDVGAYGTIKLFRDYVTDLKVDFSVEGSNHIGKSARATLYERFDESRIVICESLCTAVLYEALNSNIPVIVIEKDVYSEIRDYLFDDVLSYFYELKRIGIWYEDGTEAADFLNKNYETLDDWWLEPERQNVREKVLDRFLINRDNQVEWWKQEFANLLMK